MRTLRSFEKAMGIRTKFLIALLVILFIGGALMMTWLYYSSHENVQHQAIQSASILSDSIHEAVYGFMRTGQQNDLEAYLEKGSKLQSVDEIRVIRSASLEKELGERKNGYVKDALDLQALSSGQTIRKPVTVRRGEAIRIISPVLAEKTCMACHAEIKEGHVMALLRTTLIFQPDIDAMKRVLIKAGLMQAFILFIVIGAIFMLFNRLMVNPLSSLAAVADLIAHANLTQEVKIRSNDEIGKLATSFNNMTAGLKNIIKKVQEATSQITVATREILAASQEQASTAHDQSSAVEKTTSAAKELSSTSAQVGENIRKVAQVAAHAQEGMSKIKEAISKTHGMLTALGQKSKEIGKITEVIGDVADKTNLLAINASIEAALAGEQGRGFTVVASEIRKLADSTAQSTQDITALIGLIQHEISEAIQSMEQSVLGVDEETHLARQTTEKTKEIEMSANLQVSGFKQIADAMMGIDEAMKQIAAGAQQSQVSGKRLSELAIELKELASKFQL